MPTLVTGGGLIGSLVTARLIEKGEIVIGCPLEVSESLFASLLARSGAATGLEEKKASHLQQCGVGASHPR